MACVATGETGNLRINVIQADPLMCQHISDDIGLHLYRDLFTYCILQHALYFVYCNVCYKIIHVKKIQ